MALLKFIKAKTKEAEDWPYMEAYIGKFLFGQYVTTHDYRHGFAGPEWEWRVYVGTETEGTVSSIQECKAALEVEAQKFLNKAGLQPARIRA